MGLRSVPDSSSLPSLPPRTMPCPSWAFPGTEGKPCYTELSWSGLLGISPPAVPWSPSCPLPPLPQVQTGLFHPLFTSPNSVVPSLSQDFPEASPHGCWAQLLPVGDHWRLCPAQECLGLFSSQWHLTNSVALSFCLAMGKPQPASCAQFGYYIIRMKEVSQNKTEGRNKNILANEIQERQKELMLLC